MEVARSLEGTTNSMYALEVLVTENLFHIFYCYELRDGATTEESEDYISKNKRGGT
jgi:uncharacterized protein YpmB